ncbi:hypothetical protein BGZ65_011650, partial [Modicella reniformis]
MALIVTSYLKHQCAKLVSTTSSISIQRPCMPIRFRFNNTKPHLSNPSSNRHIKLSYQTHSRYSIYNCNNSSSSIQTDFNNEQNVQDHSSSNTQSLGPETYKHRKEEECEVGDVTKSKPKRPRKALQLLEIIAFCEANQKMSMTDISKKFNVPRSTIYGIINNKDTLKKLAK